MDSRVSMQSFYQDALYNNTQINNQLTTLEAQASTGQKFAKVSDDPAAAMAVLALSDQNDRLTSNLANIQSATTVLNGSVAALQQVNDIFSQAKAIAIQASNTSIDPTSFGTMAAQVNALLNTLLSEVNTQSGGTYVFSGGKGSTPPFAVTSTDAAGDIESVQYQGSNLGANLSVGVNQQVELYYPGSSVFQAQNRQPAVFAGNTGANPGAGTDSATGQANLVISHTATTYDPGSGVQAGTSSVGGDSILGPDGTHKLQISDTSGNGSSGTVSLDGGPPVSFSNTGTNLKVTNNNGDVVYLDTTAITPGFDGTVGITSTGSMSIDGGATSTPLTFDPSQSVTDGKTGAITYVDTSKVERTGTEAISYPGTSDVFQALIGLRDALSNVTGQPSDAQIQAITNQMNELDNVNNQVLNSLGQQSATLTSLSTLQSHLQNLQLSTQESISTTGGADMASVAVQLQAYEQMLQFSLESFAQIQSVSLLNYLH